MHAMFYVHYFKLRKLPLSIFGFLTACVYQINCSLFFIMDWFVCSPMTKYARLPVAVLERSSRVSPESDSRAHGKSGLKTMSLPTGLYHGSEYLARRLVESSGSFVGKDNSLQRTRACWFPSKSQKD